MERILLKLQSSRVETHRQLDAYFRLKVQLKEQEEENEVKIHFYRGVIAALDNLEKTILELQEESKLDKGEFEGLAMDKPNKPVVMVPPNATDVLYEELYGASGEKE